MTYSVRKFSFDALLQTITYIILFGYFGFIIIPRWSCPFSTPCFAWLVSLPIILLILVVIGIWGGIGMLRAKKNQSPSNPKHKLLFQLSALSLLWFGIAIMLASVSRYSYNHQKFNSEIWRDPNSAQFVPDSLSPRQRMTDDLVENMLPGTTQNEIESLLGVPYQSWSSDNIEHILYILGPERGFGVDDECLTIDFDKAGYFQKYKVFGNCG